MATKIKKKFIEDVIFTDITNEIDSAVSVEQARAEAAEQANAAAISAEQARAEAAEQANAAAISAEQARAEAAEGVNAAAISAEQARAMAAEGVNADAITAEETRAMAAEQANAAAISAEETRALAAEQANAADIATEKGRIDAILEASTADADSFKEIVDLINSVDTENDNAFASYVMSNDAAVAALQADVDQNEADADAAIAAEETRALAAEGVLQDNIDALQADVDQNEADADAAIAALQADVDQNELDGDNDRAAIRSEFAAADTALHTTISAEIDADVLVEKERAEAAEGVLQGNIDALQADVDQNEADGDADRALIRSEFAAADTALHTTISAEIDADVLVEKERAEAAEASLQSSIDANAAAISAEETRAMAAEGVNADAIATEKGRIDAILEASTADADSFKEIVDLINSVDTENDQAFASYVLSNDAAVAALQADVDQNELDGDNDRAAIRSEFAAADTALHTTISAEIDADVLVEKERAEAAEGVLQGNIDAEQARAMAAEGVNADAIATEKGRIDAILEASDADKDSFAEIVTLINSVDTENDQAFASYVMSNDAAVAALQADVDQNEADADAAIAALQADVDQNELDGDNDRALIRTEFADADSALHTTISAEIDADVLVEKERAEGEEALIRSEFAAADTALHTTISAEIDADVLVEKERAEAAEAGLQSSIDANADAISAEETRAMAAEVLNAAAISAEETRALAAEAGLQSSIDANAAAISAEETRALAAEGVNAAAISAEETRALAAEAGLQSSIDAEASARSAADTTLQGNIDVEKGRIDAILEASTADADSFKEIVDLINSVDTENDNAFAGHVSNYNDYVSSNDAAIAALQADVDQNEADADAAIAALQADVDQNEADGDADRAAIRSEFADADTALHTTISAEIDADVLVEKQRAEAAEASLLSQIQGNDTDIAALQADLADLSGAGGFATDAELAAAVAAEATLREDADTALSARVQVFEEVEWVLEKHEIAQSDLDNGYVSFSYGKGSAYSGHPALVFVDRLVAFEDEDFEFQVQPDGTTVHVVFTGLVDGLSSEQLAVGDELRIKFAKRPEASSESTGDSSGGSTGDSSGGSTGDSSESTDSSSSSSGSLVVTSENNTVNYADDIFGSASFTIPEGEYTTYDDIAIALETGLNENMSLGGLTVTYDNGFFTVSLTGDHYIGQPAWPVFSEGSTFAQAIGFALDTLDQELSITSASFEFAVEEPSSSEQSVQPLVVTSENNVIHYHDNSQSGLPTFTMPEGEYTTYEDIAMNLETALNENVPNTTFTVAYDYDTMKFSVGTSSNSYPRFNWQSGTFITDIGFETGFNATDQANLLVAPNTFVFQTA